jgi:hypothetical protein
MYWRIYIKGNGISPQEVSEIRYKLIVEALTLTGPFSRTKNKEAGHGTRRDGSGYRNINT